MKKGAGVAQGTGSGFHDWFHGVITRKQAEVSIYGIMISHSILKIDTGYSR